jgi:outer membrane receptor for ferrienterochelin and colicin
LIEGPLGAGITGLLNVRSTTTDYISNYLVENGERSPRFYDLQGVLGWDVTANQHASLYFLHTHDQTSGLTNGDYGATSIGGTYTASLNDHSTISGTISLYRQYDNLKRTIIIYHDVNDDEIALQEIKVSLHHWVSDIYDVLIGAEGISYDYSGKRILDFYGTTGDSLVTATVNTVSSKFAGYIENRIAINKRVLLNLGARLDYSSLTNESALAPRIIISTRLDSITTLKFAGGIYYQTPTYDQLLASSRYGYPSPTMQKAYHALIGLERPLRGDLNSRVDLFYKRLYNLIGVKQHENGELEISGRNDSEARIYGADLEISYSDSRMMGWMNYSILYANERNLLLGESWHPRVTDQRRTLNTMFEYRGFKNLTLSLRAYYGQGFPLLSDTTKPDNYTFQHQPEYKRIDFGARYIIHLTPYKLTLNIDIQNIFNNRNVASFFGTPPKESGYDWYLLLPRVINVGMKFEF